MVLNYLLIAIGICAAVNGASLTSKDETEGPPILMTGYNSTLQEYDTDIYEEQQNPDEYYFESSISGESEEIDLEYGPLKGSSKFQSLDFGEMVECDRCLSQHDATFIVWNAEADFNRGTCIAMDDVFEYRCNKAQMILYNPTACWGWVPAKRTHLVSLIFGLENEMMLLTFCPMGSTDYSSESLSPKLATITTTPKYLNPNYQLTPGPMVKYVHTGEATPSHDWDS